MSSNQCLAQAKRGSIACRKDLLDKHEWQFAFRKETATEQKLHTGWWRWGRMACWTMARQGFGRCGARQALEDGVPGDEKPGRFNQDDQVFFLTLERHCQGSAFWCCSPDQEGQERGLRDQLLQALLRGFKKFRLWQTKSWTRAPGKGPGFSKRANDRSIAIGGAKWKLPFSASHSFLLEGANC